MICLVLLLFQPDNAYAYLDPGIGSLFVQSIIAAITGGLLTLKIYWKNIKLYFYSRKHTENPKKSDEHKTIMETPEQ